MRILIGHTNKIAEIDTGNPLPGRAHRHDEFVGFGEGSAGGQAHIDVTPGMDWQDILALCPRGWYPDVYIHWSPEYNPVPEGMEAADCLTVGVFGDWNLGGRALRVAGGMFDVVVADTVGCTRLRNMGYANVVHSLLWGFDPCKHRRLDGLEKQARDIDVLMIGNFNHAVQWERAPWLARVARLSEKYRVMLTSGLYGEEYVQTMNSAKIVFNRSIRGEANMRAFEAPACGALLFYEAENREIREIFTDQEHCILYDDSNLEALLAYYLDPDHAAERELIAEQGWQQVQHHSYAHHLASLLDRLEPLLSDRSRALNAVSAAAERKITYARQWLLTGQPSWYVNTEALLSDDLVCHQPAISNIKTVLWGEMAQCAVYPGFKKQCLQTALRHAEQTEQDSPEFLIARFNLAYLQLAAGNDAEAESLLQQIARYLDQVAPVDQADRADILEQSEQSKQPELLEQFELPGEPISPTAPGKTAWQLLEPTFPRLFSWFDVALEWAYGQYAPESPELEHTIHTLLNCRIHLTLAERAYARGQYAASTRHAQAAVTSQPALGEAHYALASSLHALGRTEEALTAYDQTLLRMPFTMTAHEELIRLCLDMERPKEALQHARQWIRLLDGCPLYEAHRPAAEQLMHLAAKVTTVPTAAPVQRFLALPDWNQPTQWQAIVRAFATTYTPRDPVLLLLRVDPAAHPVARVLLKCLQQYLLADLKCGPNTIPNLTLVTEPLKPMDCWKLVRVADILLVCHSEDPKDPDDFWRDLAQARCLPIVPCAHLSEYAYQNTYQNKHQNNALTAITGAHHVSAS